MAAPTESAELTLDPADWPRFRDLAHQMVDDMLQRLETLRDRPAWQPMPAEVRSTLTEEPVPFDGVGDEAAYAAFKQLVLPYPNGNLDPRYFGWVQGNGTPLGMMADMLAAGMNPHLAGFNQAPALVEEQVIRWLAELMGFPSSASGVLVSGGSMANLLGLAVARHVKAGYDLREEGLQGRPEAPLVLYGSSETHGWAQKAVELLGLGNRWFRRIPTDANYRIDIAALRHQVAADRAQGLRPFCLIGTAGTVNTGAIDDLRGLARVAREERLWFHIDCAFGALLRLSPRLAPMVAGLEEADSLGFDLHKWGYLPFDVACALIRDSAAHQAAFRLAPSYLAAATRGVIAGGLPFADRGIDLTRGFRALKVWLSFKAHGVDLLGRVIEQNVEQARYLAARIEAEPGLELLAPVPLNIVCFRAVRPGWSAAALNDLNQRILLDVQERGVAVPSSTVLNGRFALRVAIVNHRTRREDLDALVEFVKSEE